MRGPRRHLNVDLELDSDSLRGDDSGDQSVSTVTGEQIPSGESYHVTYQADGVTLVVEAAPAAPDLTIGDVTVSEGDSGSTTATFTVTRSSMSGGDTTSATPPPTERRARRATTQPRAGA